MFNNKRAKDKITIPCNSKKCKKKVDRPVPFNSRTTFTSDYFNFSRPGKPIQETDQESYRQNFNIALTIYTFVTLTCAVKNLTLRHL